MKRSTKIITGILATAVILTGTAGGTYLLVDDVRDTVNTAAGVQTPDAATPKPVATPELIEGDEDGNGKLSEFEKQVLAKRNYVLVDGTTVPAPKQGEAVPAAIIENIKAVAGPSAEQMKYGASDEEGMEAFIVAIQAEQKRLGRTIVSVNLSYNGDCGCATWVAWTVNGAFAKQASSKDAAVATATAFAANVPNKYVVVVFD